MKNTKITPKDRRNIVNHVESGELQKDVAEKFGISEAYVSKIVKESKRQTRSPVKNFESIPIEKLLNQLEELHRQIREILVEKGERRDVAIRLRHQMNNDNETLLETDDAELRRIRADSMSAKQRMITWNENHKSLDAHLIDLYAERLSILRELFRRGHSLP